MHNQTSFIFLIKRTLLFMLLFLILQIVIGSLLSYRILVKQVGSDLEKIVNRVREDIIFQNGKWDIAAYNADTSLPNENPIYIITSDGFIIERSHPIQGLLDFSRYSLIVPYSTPTIVDTVTNEKWRVLSLPIQSDNQTVGVIFVAAYNPNEREFQEIDKQLKDAISTLQKAISVNGEQIDTTGLDPRKLPYNLSFQIVNRFNKVLFQSSNSNTMTRMPVFIDRSYVDNQLKGNLQRLVKDTLTNQRYLTLTTPIFNEKQLVAGIIVVGTSIDFIYSSIGTYALFSLFGGLLLLIILLPLGYFYFNKILRDIEKNTEIKPIPKAIIFMKKACRLTIDDHKIDIPYASYQYYFCSALFAKPQKKWEADELLEIFGEDMGFEKWRKVYDTMVALNRKSANFVNKLFIVKDKRYSLNTQMSSTIQLAD